MTRAALLLLAACAAAWWLRRARPRREPYPDELPGWYDDQRVASGPETWRVASWRVGTTALDPEPEDGIQPPDPWPAEVLRNVEPAPDPPYLEAVALARMRAAYGGKPVGRM